MSNHALKLTNMNALPPVQSGSRPASMADLEIGHEFHYWRGASGRRYLHSAYPLTECPEIPAANYVLVRRNDDGRRQALFAGRTRSEAGSLNLAFIRQTAARLGANEVHIHVMTDNLQERQAVERDLRLGLFSSLTMRLLAGVHNGGGGRNGGGEWPLAASNQNARPEN